MAPLDATGVHAPTKASAEAARRASKSNVRNVALDRAAGIRRRSRADARRELLAGQDRLRDAAARLDASASSNSTAATAAAASSCAASSRRCSSTAPRELNDAVGAHDRRVAEHRRGSCAASTSKRGYRVCRGLRRTTSVAFVRYENFDTQFRMPAGFMPLKEFDRDAWVAGVTYYPDPDVAREDRLRRAAQPAATSSAAPTAFNIGLGWWF